MNFDKMSVGWFDLLVIIMALLGARQGRKNGMSVECVVMLQWVAIISACAFLYRPLGDALSDSSPMSHLFCYIACYISTAMVVKVIFSLIKKGAGGKLTGSDLFGRGEFYLGTGAGMVRFLCILIAGTALLNAREYTQQEVTASIAFQKDVYGSTFFPELCTIQADVFKSSFCGKAIKDYAPFLLIHPTPPEHKEMKKRSADLP